mmetsp:Transcript_17911/g.25792  ORF Transcript_17911/g.25792 Transcript_17911/m.25792 type:complete len:214 (+) Transcript_17911:983-1624(+)
MHQYYLPPPNTASASTGNTTLTAAYTDPSTEKKSTFPAYSTLNAVVAATEFTTVAANYDRITPTASLTISSITLVVDDTQQRDQQQPVGTVNHEQFLQESTTVFDEVYTDDENKDIFMSSFFICAAAEALTFILNESSLYKEISGHQIFKDISEREDTLDIQFTDLIRGYCSQNQEEAGFRSKITECSGRAAIFMVLVWCHSFSELVHKFVSN